MLAAKKQVDAFKSGMEEYFSRREEHGEEGCRRRRAGSPIASTPRCEGVQGEGRLSSPVDQNERFPPTLRSAGCFFIWRQSASALSPNSLAPHPTRIATARTPRACAAHVQSTDPATAISAVVAARPATATARTPRAREHHRRRPAENGQDDLLGVAAPVCASQKTAHGTSCARHRGQRWSILFWRDRPGAWPRPPRPDRAIHRYRKKRRPLASAPTASVRCRQEKMSASSGPRCGFHRAGRGQHLQPVHLAGFRARVDAYRIGGGAIVRATRGCACRACRAFAPSPARSCHASSTRRVRHRRRPLQLAQPSRGRLGSAARPARARWRLTRG